MINKIEAVAVAEHAVRLRPDAARLVRIAALAGDAEGIGPLRFHRKRELHPCLRLPSAKALIIDGQGFIGIRLRRIADHSA